MRVDALVGTLGWAAGLGWLALVLGRRFVPRLVLLGFGAAAALVATPYLRGLFADLSMTSMVLSAAAIGAALGRSEWLPRPEVRATFHLVLAGALFLYPMALGVGPFDPYDLGYRSPWVIVVFGAVAIFAWKAGLRLPVACLVAAVGAFAAGVLASQNLWDYLLDPFVVVVALVSTGRNLWKEARHTEN